MYNRRTKQQQREQEKKTDLNGRVGRVVVNSFPSHFPKTTLVLKECCLEVRKERTRVQIPADANFFFEVLLLFSAFVGFFVVVIISVSTHLSFFSVRMFVFLSCLGR